MLTSLREEVESRSNSALSAHSRSPRNFATEPNGHPEVPRSETKRHHYPALDGLRGFAFLSVFLSHYYAMAVPDTLWNWGGWLGVDLFFVLSGFLITGILFDSLPRPRYFRNFYIRRALRIFPLYYGVWIVFFLLTPWLHPLWTIYDASRLLYFANLMDFYRMSHPVAETGFLFHTLSGKLSGFNTGALWSLSLEEQFYLFWPMVVFLIKDRRRLLWVCGCAVFGCVALNASLVHWAMAHGVDRFFLYEATYAHVLPMFAGAWLALWLRGQPAGTTVNARVYGAVILIPGAVLAFLLLHVIGHYDVLAPTIPTIGYLCSGVMFAGVVLAVIQPSGLLKWAFSLRPLISVGVISYGLYILHGYLMSAYRHHQDDFARRGLLWLIPVSAFPVVYGLAWLSYRYFESPFLRLKDRWAPSVPVSVTGRDPDAQPRRSEVG